MNVGGGGSRVNTHIEQDSDKRGYVRRASDRRELRNECIRIWDLGLEPRGRLAYRSMVGKFPSSKGTGQSDSGPGASRAIRYGPRRDQVRIGHRTQPHMLTQEREEVEGRACARQMYCY